MRKRLSALRLQSIAPTVCALGLGLGAQGALADDAVVKHMTVNGAVLTYQEQGKGAPIVFVHGAIGDYRTWQGEREAIASGHRFIALTLRYFGTEAWPDDGKNFSFVNAAEDIAGFIKGLDEGPVDLVGWSMSGPLTMLVAINHPDIVRRLFVYEPSDGGVVTDPSEKKALEDAAGAMFGPVGAAAKVGGPNAAAKVLSGAVNGQPDTFDHLAPYFQTIMLDNARTLPLAFPATPPPVTCASLGGMKMPVTIARGADTEAFFRIIADAAVKCVPSANLVVMPKERHLAPILDAAAFSGAVLEFVDAK